uniref:Galactose-specific lectin nattectin-like n=1 Tax=Labrus bergylta TaxID=56723 RepID=A0A3Q3GCS2_9LABR
MKMLTGLLLVCATMALTNAAGDISVQVLSSVCPSGWTQYDDRCFLYVSKAMTWANAEINCQAQGGNLASVHSLSEYAFIQGLIHGITHRYPQTWLGGSDAQEGVWLWTDGSRFNSLNWWGGWTDNNLNQQHCLQMNWGERKTFDDVQCWYNLGFVCAKPI